jgi:hypothetical protein
MQRRPIVPTLKQLTRATAPLLDTLKAWKVPTVVQSLERPRVRRQYLERRTVPQTRFLASRHNMEHLYDISFQEQSDMPDVIKAGQELTGRGNMINIEDQWCT